MLTKIQFLKTVKTKQTNFISIIKETQPFKCL